MAMMSARVLAEHLGCPFRICWREQDWLPFSRFDLGDIFLGLDAECWTGPEPGEAYGHEHHAPGPVPEVEARLRAGMTVWLESYCFIKPADLGQADFLAALHRQFARLQPRTEVLVRLPVLSPGAVGVQIRRTDHWCATRYSPLRLFFKIMDGHVAEVPATSFYLATDDPAVKRVMKKRYGSRLLTAPEVPAPTPAETAQAALADMLALSRTSIIYHSVMSSFGFVAHHWTRCPLRCVSTPGMPTQWQGSPADRQLGQLIEWNWEAMAWRLQGHTKTSLRLRWTARLYLAWSRMVRSRIYQCWPFHVLTVR
jgi:hypothetical protein